MFDRYFDHWGLFVGGGLAVLAVGTVTWSFACLRLFLGGRRRVASALWFAGAVLVGGNVFGAIALDCVLQYRTAGPNSLVSGLPIGKPELLLLPDDTLTWAITGLSMVLLAAALLAVRVAPRVDPDSSPS